MTQDASSKKLNEQRISEKLIEKKLVDAAEAFDTDETGKIDKGRHTLSMKPKQQQGRQGNQSHINQELTRR